MIDTIPVFLRPRFITLVTTIVLACIAGDVARASDNETVAAALSFTRGFAEKHHLVAAVQLRDRKGKIEKFQYDRVGDVERIRRDDGTYARKEGGAWLKSDDWAEHGSEIDKEEAEELEHLGEIIEGILETKDEPALRTWRRLDESKETSRQTFRAARSAGGPETYPRLTFEALPDAKPGEMLLREAAGAVFVGRDVKVVTMRVAYGTGLDKSDIPVPALPSSSTDTR